MYQRKNNFKKFIWLIISAFLLMNIVAYFHAYKFTHFENDDVAKTKNPNQLKSFDKIKTILFGVKNPKPKNIKMPNGYFKIVLQSNKKIECWYLKNKKSTKTDTVKGTVILFHGYASEKSSMLDKAQVFDNLKFDVLLVDFMGCGGSEGNQTTIGYKEAEEVKTAFNFLKNKGEKNIYLFGTSMGSVAIMKAIADYNLKPKGIMIECPFGSMYKTTTARFKTMNVPSFPMAGLLVFWGGVQNNFWGFSHNPSEYAKKINCPTLLMYGGLDEKVSYEETDEIYNNFKGKKIKKIFEYAGHENYLGGVYQYEWIDEINRFLMDNK